MSDTQILSDEEVAEVAEMFPHAEYNPHLSPDEVDLCEFCKGTIDDHKANCVVPHVHALCHTVRALRKYSEFCDNRHTGMAEDLDICRSKIESLTQERDRLREDLRILTKGRFIQS